MNFARYRALIFDSCNFSFLMVVVALALQSPDEDYLRDHLNHYFLFSLFMVVMGAILSGFIRKKNFPTLGSVLFTLPQEAVAAEAIPFFGSFWGFQTLISLLVSIGVGVWVTKTNLGDVFDEKGIHGAINLFAALFNPNWRLLPQAIINVVVTIFMAFIATVFAIPIAFVMSFFCAKNIMRHPFAQTIYYLLRTGLNFTRSIEALIWAIIFSVWVGIGPFAGMLALMIHSIASLAKQYSEMVESVSVEPIDGILSTGASFLQTLWFAIVPQVLLPFISFTVYRWDTNVRMATIIGFVGGGGIGTMLLKYQGQAMWNEVGTIVIVIAVVVWAMDQASAIIREALK